MALTQAERRWMLVLFDAILPARPGSRLALGAKDVPSDVLVADLYRAAPGHFTLGLRAAIWLAYWSPVVRRLRSFGRLSREERVRHLKWLAGSRFYLLREAPTLLKMVATLAFGALPEVQTRIGLPPANEEPPEWLRGAGP